MRILAVSKVLQALRFSNPQGDISLELALIALNIRLFRQWRNLERCNLFICPPTRSPTG